MKKIIYNCSQCNNDASDVFIEFNYPSGNFHICKICSVKYTLDKIWDLLLYRHDKITAYLVSNYTV